MSAYKKLAIKIGLAQAGLKIKINHSIHSTFLLRFPLLPTLGRNVLKETTSQVTEGGDFQEVETLRSLENILSVVGGERFLLTFSLCISASETFKKVLLVTPDGS